MAADVVPDYAGPLAGVLTGLDWAAEHAPGARWVATFATDAPFQPTDLVERLLAAVEREGADMACARSGGREHPVFGLWPVHLRHDLRRAMLEEQIRKVDVWTARYRLAIADFDCRPGRSLLQHQPPRRSGGSRASADRASGGLVSCPAPPPTWPRPASSGGPAGGGR